MNSRIGSSNDRTGRGLLTGRAGCSTREATPLKLWVSSSSAHARHNLRLHLRLGNFEEVRR